MKYQTNEQKLKALKNKGLIVTFKEAQYASVRQFILVKIKKTKSKIQLIGEWDRNSKEYNTEEELLNSIDWSFMEKAID
jgi:hypothetical protein